MAQYTLFAKQIKKQLVDMERTQDWLIKEVREKTNRFLDSGYLYKIMIGERNAPTICNAICEILGIDYIPEKENPLTKSG